MLLHRVGSDLIGRGFQLDDSPVPPLRPGTAPVPPLRPGTTLGGTSASSPTVETRAAGGLDGQVTWRSTSGLAYSLAQQRGSMFSSPNEGLWSRRTGKRRGFMAEHAAHATFITHGISDRTAEDGGQRPWVAYGSTSPVGAPAHSARSMSAARISAGLAVRPERSHAPMTPSWKPAPPPIRPPRARSFARQSDDLIRWEHQVYRPAFW